MKVAIVGHAQGWDAAPFEDPTWDVWGLNDGYLLYPEGRITRWFELHGDTPLTRSRRPPDHFERLGTLGIPVYYLTGDPPCASAVKYPLEAAIAVGRDYFACTNAYQIALALHEGATEIALFGAPLQANREVVVERPCVAWWLGLAEGRGVRVTVNNGDRTIGLLQHPFRYAFDDESERLSVYGESLRVGQSLGSWLLAEASRLGLVDDESSTKAEDAA